MAIVINGSGTVTGISVGGLPDGIVDAGTLATNSVDSAELIDGAVDNSHMAAMAASKLTGALPAISGASLTNLPATDISGKLNLSGGTMSGDLKFADGDKITFGEGDDLQIRHTGTTSYLQDAGDGDLIIKSNGTNVKIIGDNDEDIARFSWNGTAELYNNGVKRLETSDTGIRVTGGINIADNRGIAIGDSSQANDVSGAYNVAVGPHTLLNNTTSRYNTAVGYQAMRYCEVSGTNGYNTAIGRQALQGDSSGYSGGFNVGVGCSTGYAMTSAAGNVMVGYASGYDLLSGDSNVLLGTNAGRGATSPVGVTTSDGIICLGNNNTTALYCADTSISSSDQRDKADIEDFTAGLSFVNQMRPVTYRWDKRSWYINQETGTIEDVLNAVPDGTHKKTKQHVGFLSQEIEVLEKEIGFATSKDNQLFCNTNPDDIAMGLKYERLIPVLVNAIKELSAKVEALENP